MSDGDRVELVFVTYGNHLLVECYRHEATAIIRSWYGCRDQVYLDGPNAEQAAKHLKRGSYAANMVCPGLDACMLAVGWEHVVGMYVREIRGKPRLVYKGMEEMKAK